MIRDTPCGSERIPATICPHVDCPHRAAGTEVASAREVALNLFCFMLLIAVLIPCVRVVGSWAGRKSQQFVDQLIWRETIERW
jgi:hypothetical protein